jgi:uncharacterized membrane protein YhaH (DUF805 family)
MKWFIKVLKQYADFKSRARRKEYWMFYLVSTIVSWAILGILSLFLVNLSQDKPSEDMLAFFGIIYYIYLFAMKVPSIAVSVRRLHDVNKSGWHLLWMVLPIIGWFWVIYLHVKKGDVGTNKYGTDPKNPLIEIDEIGAVEG